MFIYIRPMILMNLTTAAYIGNFSPKFNNYHMLSIVLKIGPHRPVALKTVIRSENHENRHAQNSVKPVVDRLDWPIFMFYLSFNS